MAADVYPADLYAAVHTGNAGDCDFYRAACRGVDAVLELGCGDGRVALEVAREARLVIGLDMHHGALVRAARAGLLCFRADMQNFALARQFDRIIIPYNGLYCLLDDDALQACLTAVRLHLAPGGQLIFDGYRVHLFDEGATTAPLSTAPEALGSVSVDGQSFAVFEQSVLWPGSQRVDAEYRHVSHNSGEELVAVIKQRYLMAEALPALLAEAGLMLAALEGGFHGEPFDDEAEHLVVRAQVGL